MFHHRQWVPLMCDLEGEEKRGAGSNQREDNGGENRPLTEQLPSGSFTYVTLPSPRAVNIMPIFGRLSRWGGDKNSRLGFSELV